MSMPYGADKQSQTIVANPSDQRVVGSADQQQDYYDSISNKPTTTVSGPNGEPIEEVVVEAGRGLRPFSISDFLSRNQPNGFARTSRYFVKFNGLNSLVSTEPVNQLSLLCESVDFPGRDLNTEDIRIYGPIFKVPTLSTYPDITMTFLCDLNLNQKQLFEDWMNIINPNTTYNFLYKNDYACEIEINQLDVYASNGTPFRRKYGMILREAFPTSVQSMQANWSDDAFHKLQVTFAYTKWESVQYNVDDYGKYQEKQSEHATKVQQAAYDRGNVNPRGYDNTRNIEHRRKVQLAALLRTIPQFEPPTQF